jgi:hypothetical protein
MAGRIKLVPKGTIKGTFENWAAFEFQGTRATQVPYKHGAPSHHKVSMPSQGIHDLLISGLSFMVAGLGFRKFSL